MHALVTRKDKDTLEVTSVVSIWNRDPFFKIKKKVRVATMQLEQPDEEDEDEEEIPITRPRSMRKPPLTKPDHNGKTIATSPEKLKKSDAPQINNSKKQKEKRTLIGCFFSYQEG